MNTYNIYTKEGQIVTSVKGTAIVIGGSEIHIVEGLRIVAAFPSEGGFVVVKDDAASAKQN